MANTSSAVHDDENEEVIRVSYMENMAKYYVDENGDYRGFSTEIFKHIAGLMGHKLEIVPRPTFRALSDFYTGASAYTFSPDGIIANTEGVLKTDDIICLSYSFVAKQGQEVKSISDLAGKRVGFGLAGSYLEKYEEQLEASGKSMIPILTSSATEAIRMLAYDRVDVAFFPTFFYQAIIDADQEMTGIPQSLKETFGKPVVMERVNMKILIHPNSPLYPSGEEMIKMINDEAKKGVFLDILSKAESDKDAFCNMELAK